jgi:hypothetical protein
MLRGMPQKTEGTDHRQEPPAVRHLGPMAQDFRAAFGLGDDDRTLGKRLLLAVSE